MAVATEPPVDLSYLKTYLTTTINMTVTHGKSAVGLVEMY